ncbi:MAG: MMPL family transporter [bacterium]
MVKLSVFLARISRRSFRTVLLVVVLLCIVSLAGIMVRGFTANLLDLIPAHAEKTRLYLQLVRDFGIMDDVYVLLDGDIQRNRFEIRAFKEELSRSDLVREVSSGLDPAVLQFLGQVFRQDALLYLSDDELNSALARLRPDEMEKQVKKMKSRLVLPSGLLSMSDPLGFSDFVMPHMPSFTVPVDLASGSFSSQDGRRLFIVIKPAGEARDIDYGRKLLAFIDAAFKKHFSDNRGMHIGVTGNHAITYHEQEIMKRDIQWNFINSFLSVALVFWFFLRNMRAMVYTFIPILLSVVITLGVASTFFGAMSEVSGAFGAMLVGLGDDLAIMLYIRFLLDLNITSAVEDTATPIWAGVLTTAATFYPMLLSDFRGIREFGFLTATGIILCGVFVFLLSAPLMGRGKPVLPRHTGVEILPVYAVKHRKVVILLFIVVAVVSLIGFRRITFTADLQSLGARENPARRLFSSAGIEQGGTFVTGIVPTRDEAVRESAAVVQALRGAGMPNTLSLASFIPPREQQLRNIKKMQSVDLAGATRTFISLAKKYGFSDTRIWTMAENMKGFLSVGKPLEIETLSTTGMGDFLGRFCRQEDGGYRYLVMVQNGNDAEDVLKDHVVVGSSTVKAELSSMLKKNAILITLLGILLANVVIYIKFRNILYTVYAQIPVLLSILATGAVLTWCGVHIHIMNAVVAVMLYGIGTDYSIHLIHHLMREQGMDGLVRGPARALTFAAYTTIVGFGSIYFSSYQGLSEMGLAVTIGIFFTLLFSLALIPVLMQMKQSGGDR